MFFRKVIILFVFFLMSLSVSGQNNIFFNFKSNYKRGDILYERQAYVSALELYSRVYQKDSNNTVLIMKMIDCLRKLNRIGETEHYYDKIIHNLSVIKPVDKLQYAEALLQNGKTDEAKKYYLSYSLDNPADSTGLLKASLLNNINTFISDSLGFTIKPLAINSPASDFGPVYHNNGIVFLSARKPLSIVQTIDASSNRPFFDLYYSPFVSPDSLGVPQKFSEGPGFKYNQGSFCVFDDGKKAIFSGNASETVNEGISRLMLYLAERDTSSGTWKNIKPLPFNNPAYSVAHPSFDNNTATLYFVSDMPGGYGGTDIYESSYIDGSFTSPVNLGNKVNTSGNEMFPSIYQDSVLFFSSNGHPGIGGQDIYSSTKRNGGFNNLTLLSYPLNSSADDFALAISEDGKTGYFSSNRKSGVGEDDLYAFKINIVYLKLLVADRIGTKVMNDVKIKVTDQITRKEIYNGNDPFYKLTPGKEYLVEAYLDGYKPIKKIISTRDSKPEDKINEKLMLERRNKAYVKGIVKDSADIPVANAMVKIVNKAGMAQNLQTDTNGVFRCEIDGDYETNFVAESKGRLAVEKTRVQSRKKGSTVINLEFDLKRYKTIKLTGSVKNARTKQPLVGYEVYITDETTLERTEICTDENGLFRFDASNYTTYSIESIYNQKKAEIHNIKPKANQPIELFWE